MPEPAPEANMYDSLGVSSDATSTEIRRAYRNLITKVRAVSRPSVSSAREGVLPPRGTGIRPRSGETTGRATRRVRLIVRRNTRPDLTFPVKRPSSPQNHPDKGGDAVAFAAIQRAYDVLSDAEKRRRYDATGTYEKTVEEELLEDFGGGAFRDRGVESEVRTASLADAIVKTEENKSSHTAGFEAWMRARVRMPFFFRREAREADSPAKPTRPRLTRQSLPRPFRASQGDANMTFGVDDIIDTYGVVKGSYEEVSLPKIRAFRVDYVGGPARPAGPEGPDAPRFRLSSEPIPSTLEWGEVLVNFRAVPINPADLHPNRGADAGAHPRAPPFAAGSDGVGVVLKVGAGVKHLREGDWATPLAPGLGTWRSLATLKEKHLMKIPADLMPVEYAATWREMCVAYRLLEDSPELRPGDAVVVNGANGAVGAATLQLCALLKLRAVAVTRPRKGSNPKGSNPDGDEDSAGSNPAVDSKTTARLLALGAAEVLADEGNLRDALERRRFFAKPKLGLDCVGGVSAARLADALQDGSRLVCFGCMSGRPVTLPWTSLVARGLRVEGFSLRAWMRANKKRAPKMLETVAKIARADKLRVEHTEYELSSEFAEAIEHAAEDARGTKIILRVEDVGSTYE